MLSEYAKALPNEASVNDGWDFLMEEISVLEEAQGVGFPNFLPRTAFLILLQKNVKKVSYIPQDLVLKVWSYVEDVVVRVLQEASDIYPPLQACTRRAAHNLMGKMKTISLDHVKELVQMEIMIDYTSNPEYMKTWVELMELQGCFMKAVVDETKPTLLGEVDVSHLRGKYSEVIVEQAFDMKMRLIAYWKTVALRLVDSTALRILYAVKKLVENELESEIIGEVVGGQRMMNGIEKMLEESPGNDGKRERLKRSIQLLKESKEVLAKIMDRISLNSD